MEAPLLDRLAAPPLAQAAPVTAGAYLTDETNLYRCVPSDEPGAVLLEDCMTLELISCYFDEVATMRLVRAAR